MAHLVHLPIKLMVLVILVSQRAFPITALSPSPCLQSATRLVALDETYTVAGHESLVISGLSVYPPVIKHGNGTSVNN